MNVKYLALLAAVVGLTGCGATSSPTASQQTLVVPDCVYPDAPTQAAPLWVCDVPIEGFALTSVGYSEKKPTLSMTTTSARTDAGVKMSEHFATSVSQLLTEYQKQMVTNDEEKILLDNDLVRESLTAITLFGAKTARSITSPSQGHYVVLAMDKATYEANAEKAFAALSNDNANMRRLFNDEKARERLMSLIKVK
ncbi:hypothetical protein [Agaribacter marinus]|uniref:LPP20 lipoprotein n=1 Tax=Agaribacter marinus TaxID=1431249 RepID=A0AA37WFZ3_9ALTE|nr:hypothetical protein [Agaribacter marinus]GLR69436.1 hypothetical protein GCM10007852_03440 [Agaribacter marinus]